MTDRQRFSSVWGAIEAIPQPAVSMRARSELMMNLTEIIRETELDAPIPHTATDGPYDPNDSDATTAYWDGARIKRGREATEDKAELARGSKAKTFPASTAK